MCHCWREGQVNFLVDLIVSSIHTDPKVVNYWVCTLLVCSVVLCCIVHFLHEAGCHISFDWKLLIGPFFCCCCCNKAKNASGGHERLMSSISGVIVLRPAPSPSRSALWDKQPADTLQVTSIEHNLKSSSTHNQPVCLSSSNYSLNFK